MTTSDDQRVVAFGAAEKARLRRLVDEARAELAALEAEFTTEKRAVDVLEAKIFVALRSRYQERDQLELLIEYRREVLDALRNRKDEDERLRNDDYEWKRNEDHEWKRSEEAERLRNEYAKARDRCDQEYREAETALIGLRAPMSEDEKTEIKKLWQKLVRLYHPDRYANDPDKLATYQRLTSLINQARDRGDIALLREIANDPTGFMLRQGWVELDLSDSRSVEEFERLLELLREQIAEMAASLAALRDSPEYDLFRVSETQPDAVQAFTNRQAEILDGEIATLKVEADKLAREIFAVTGEPCRPL